MKKVLSLLLCTAVLVLLTSCGSGLAENTVRSVSDIEGKKVGVLKDSETARFLERYSGRFEINYYSSREALAGDLKSGVLDCAVVSKSTAESIKKSEKHLGTLSEPLIEEGFFAAVSLDNTELLSNINSALKKLSDAGTLSKINNKWLKGSGKYTAPVSEKGERLAVAVCMDFGPYAFYDENGEPAGLEIDVIKAVCAELGFVPDFKDVDESDLVYMAESGKVSFAIGRIAGDAGGNVLYSEVYSTSVQCILVRDD